MKKVITILLILLMNTFAALSQELRLVVSDQPLNVVLGNLSVEVSFNDKALSAYKVSVKKTFRSPEEALTFLLKDKPFTFRKIRSVYVIYSKKETEEDKPQEIVTEVKRQYSFSGIVLDSISGEQLPYSYISTSEGMIMCDESGYFNLKRNNNQPINIQVQYLGYDVMDTLLNVGIHQLKLSPKSIHMNEVVVNSPPATMLIQSGKTSGEIRVNHQVARYMPGSIDNSVFNLLRMMPGVRASGEPSDDLIVWGSNIGESQVTYDGYTLFGLKNYNDHIGSVNPYMVKDIRLLKGGFNSSHGDRIGSVAEITGYDGDFDSPSVKSTISNYTANVFASTPLSKRVNISAAYRQTFYNLYDKENANVTANKGNGMSPKNQSSTYIKPDYAFKDLNFKLSGKAFRNDSYYVSLYGADDRFKFSVEQQDEFEVDASVKNKQLGGAASYKRLWDDGATSKLLATYSSLSSNINNLTLVRKQMEDQINVSSIDNSVQEVSIKLSHEISIGNRNRIQFGTDWQHYEVLLDSKSNTLSNPSIYITDNISIGNLSLEGGIRADFPSVKKAYLQPRFSGKYTISEELTATASWGIYNQFLRQIPFEKDGTFEMIWSLSDTTYTSAMHTLGGIAYSKNGFLFSVEGYYKHVNDGLFLLNNTVNKADNTIIGVDLYAKKEIGRNTVFASYSLTNLKKPQNETTHEIKIGGVASLEPFFFSLNYVYGTGFSYITTGGHQHMQNNGRPQQGGMQQSSNSENEPYSRFDVGATYKLKLNKIKLQTGISVLNVFDTKNIKYNYQLGNQNDVANIFTKATPFTPTVFIEIIF